MSAEAHEIPAEPWQLDDPERVALAYHQASGGDAWRALVAMAGDALADRDALAKRLAACRGQVSAGYVRGGLDG